MDNPVVSTYKRKRKKSFLKNARKYGKRGYYGRGSQLDPDTYQYFIRILEAFKDVESDEEKRVMVNNVFIQTESDEIKCSSNQVGCRAVQMLLPFANDHHLSCYLDAFLSNLRPLACDRFATHVLQTLIEIAHQKSVDPSTDPAFSDKCKTSVIKISKFLLNNLEDYVWDTYGNHVIRTVFAKFADDFRDEYGEILEDYARRLLLWPQFSQFGDEELTSGLLQALLTALKAANGDLLKTFIKQLVNECFAKRAPNFEKPVVMLLEVAVEVAPSKLFAKIYRKCFKGNLVAMANNRCKNFAVQKLMNVCGDKELFEEIFDEISDSFGEIMKVGHTGVVLAAAQSCKRLCTKQGMFVQQIMKSLNCHNPEERQNSTVACLCLMVPYDDLPKTVEAFCSAKYNLHGILIVQVALEFNKPIKIVNSILSNSQAYLKCLFMNTMGCHIVDSYVSSKFVGEASREKLIRLMHGAFQDLATSKYGSRSLEAIWKTAQLKQRLIIMKELGYKDALWSNTEFGKIVASSISLPLYKKSVEEWKIYIVKPKLSL